MRLRPRQSDATERCVSALSEFKNTLLVAPTGAGKTIMLSAVTGRRIHTAKEGEPAKALILQHRDELTDQNAKKFRKVNPNIPISIFDAKSKSWAGRCVFGMVQTVVKNLDRFPKLGTLTIDEAHHSTAGSYRKVIDRAREVNPDVAIFGVTATPNRGDGTPMRDVYDNVADQISIGELIATGHLVRPRTYAIDVGATQALSQLPSNGGDFAQQAAVAAIMDREIITDRVVELWLNGDAARSLPSCKGRPTVVFCSTVAHAEHVASVFAAHGVSAATIHGNLSPSDRTDTLARYEKGRIQVLVNVAVLTEGWDHPPTSCVILLRLSSYKSTMVQMIGRGLRVVDPAEHPGVVKTDCIVLDFGTATLTHGALEEEADLDGRPKDPDLAPRKQCPGCDAMVPIATLECPLCGYQWERPEKQTKSELRDFVLTEIDLLAKSNFKWVDIWGDEKALMAGGFDAWSGIFWWHGAWHAVGGNKDELRHLGVGDRLVALALGDDYMNDNETDGGAKKTKKWLREPASEKQLAMLGLPPTDMSVSKYQAMCKIGFRRNKRNIQNIVMDYAKERQAA